MKENENQIVVYQPDEVMRLEVRLENETVWLTQAQLCELLQRDVSVISRHILDDKELYLIMRRRKRSFRRVASSEARTRRAHKRPRASLKDLGKKCFGFTKMDAGEIPGIKARV